MSPPVATQGPAFKHPCQVLGENETSLAYTAFGPLQLRLGGLLKAAKHISSDCLDDPSLARSQGPLRHSLYSSMIWSFPTSSSLNRSSR